MMFLKQSTAVDIALGPFLDSTDGVTAETALTISQADVRLKKNAGNWAQKNQASSCTHEENGWYECSLDATDTDTLGRLVVAVAESGALPVWHEFHVVSANVYDVLFSTDKLEVDVLQWNGTNVAAPTTAGVPNVTVQALTAAALADFFDTNSGTAYASAVAGSVVKEIADNSSVVGDWTSSEREQIRKALGITGVQANTTGDGHLDAIKLQTDKLQFSSDNDVKATLDSELVTLADSSLTEAKIAAGALTATKFGSAILTEDFLETTGANRIADVVLRRSLASVESSSYGDALTLRSLYGAAAKQANKTLVSGGVLTVYKSNDADALGTQTVTFGTASALPIVGLDTV